jgi:hypothetical protein
MSAHMDQLIAEFEKFQAKVRQAEATFAGVGDMQERVAEVESVVTSPDRNVTVSAGAGGMVTDIQLAPGAMRLAPTELSATILNTLRQAVAGAVRQQAEIVDDAFGDAFGINTSAQVRQAQAEAFGTPTDDAASHEEVSTRRTIPPDDDTYEQDSIYRR